MAAPRYEEISCRQALNRVAGMPFKWSLNPYRGCRHACVYCFARSTHAYFELGAGDDFSGVIFVKTNVAEVLATELSRRTWKRESVSLGTATDPYQPIEGTYRLTRACLLALARFRTPVAIVTKGTMMLRDLDVLADLSERGGITVVHSIPTVDEEIWRRSEPGTPPPRQRLMAMRRLRENGIRAGVLMAPLLPDLSARPEALARTAEAALAHGACFLGVNTLNLGPGVREYYMSFLEREYPELTAEYERLYPTRYAPRWLQDDLQRRVRDLKELYQLEDRYPPPRQPPPEAVQLPLDL